MSDTGQRTASQRYGWLVVVGIVLLCFIGYSAREYCFRWIGMSLIIDESVGSSDAILLDNHNYLLFERAQQLQSRGFAEVVLVPFVKSEKVEQPEMVYRNLIRVLCRISRVRDAITFDVPEREPIDLNIAKRGAEQLHARNARSVIVVTDGFRSRRTAEIYSRVMKPKGIHVFIQPVFGSSTPGNWFRSWHGFQNIALQLGRLWYYRLAVL